MLGEIFLFCFNCHNHSNFSDLHCSSEDEEADDDMMEEVKGDEDDSIDYSQTQVAAAEAMMQLGNFAFYNTSGSGKYQFTLMSFWYWNEL